MYFCENLLQPLKDAGHWCWRDTAERRKDRDGTKDGYDIHVTKTIRRRWDDESHL
ncbi:MAG: hypothetical protein KAU52_07560 [Methanosarcinales archaeon]|nr:hypothetical protein [Methanosarcinales archaeon]